MLDDVISQAELCRLFNIDRATAFRWRTLNGLPHFVVNGKVYYNRREVEAWLSKRRVKTAPTRRKNELPRAKKRPAKKSPTKRTPSKRSGARRGRRKQRA